jgi:hypothetical protein
LQGESDGKCFLDLPLDDFEDQTSPADCVSRPALLSIFVT